MLICDLDAVLADDLDHLGGERQIVGGIAKQRIRRDLHLVVVDAGPVSIAQPVGGLVGEEVDLVAALGKREAQLGRDDAGAAVGRVARDSDLHEMASQILRAGKRMRVPDSSQ